MDSMEEYEIRFAYNEEWQEAMTIAWKTFLKFEACDYSERGVQSFQEFITDETLRKMFIKGEYRLLVALKDKKIVGIISVRDGSHISLLFVDEMFHKKGIGRLLVNTLGKYLKQEEGKTKMTVNAAPYAIGFYHKLGFADIQTEQETDGIRYTPMELNF
ncbi:MAG: GNAT family N-acetyltransferase [Lachnospiraceae bacterium]|nr:GNAT family N-acetyltransferase [Lachnospiraceae bacterium]